MTEQQELNQLVGATILSIESVCDETGNQMLIVTTDAGTLEVGDDFGPQVTLNG